MFCYQSSADSTMLMTEFYGRHTFSVAGEIMWNSLARHTHGPDQIYMALSTSPTTLDVSSRRVTLQHIRDLLNDDALHNYVKIYFYLLTYLKLGLWRGTFTCVGWQVTQCDHIWQVTLRSSVMGFSLRAILGFNL